MANHRTVAITGGIAEGKTTVLGLLGDAGYQTASADDIAREVFGSGEVQAKLASLLDLVEPITSGAVRAQIVKDPEKRRAVNRITHPRILERLGALSGVDFVEVPLLVETCLQGMFDGVWVVSCGPEEQLSRLQERLGSRSAARETLATQLPTDVKIAFADVLVRTNRSRDTVKRFVLEVVRGEFG